MGTKSMSTLRCTLDTEYADVSAKHSSSSEPLRALYVYLSESTLRLNSTVVFLVRTQPHSTHHRHTGGMLGSPVAQFGKELPVLRLSPA
jgi:hypothetical protein